ncbi:hypothetical protein D3C71_1296020 [compost metagenome]
MPAPTLVSTQTDRHLLQFRRAERIELHAADKAALHIAEQIAANISIIKRRLTADKSKFGVVVGGHFTAGHQGFDGLHGGFTVPAVFNRGCQHLALAGMVGIECERVAVLGGQFILRQRFNNLRGEAGKL